MGLQIRTAFVRWNKREGRRRKKQGALERAYLIIDAVAQSKAFVTDSSITGFFNVDGKGGLVNMNR